MIFVNFKTYQSGTGFQALDMASILEAVSRSSHIKLVPVVQALDLRLVADKISLEVWIQNIDNISYGAHTGHILPEGAVEAGAKGVFLNHSENKAFDFEELTGKCVRAREAGLKTLVFARDLEELSHVVTLTPDFVAYEPPELIGSKDKSVSTQKPETVKEAVELAQSNGLPLIVGAGIHTGEDIKISLGLGASGFAVASGIMQAQDFKSAVEELIKGYL